MKPKLEKIDPTQFHFRLWEAGTIHEIINGPCHYWNLTAKANRERLKRYAIGWCNAERLSFKPKQNEVAIMCFKDEKHFWFHLRKGEFNRIWRE